MIKVKIFSNANFINDGKTIEDLANEWFAKNPNIKVISTNFSMASSCAALVITYKEKSYD